MFRKLGYGSFIQNRFLHSPYVTVFAFDNVGAGLTTTLYTIHSRFCSQRLSLALARDLKFHGFVVS